MNNVSINKYLFLQFVVMLLGLTLRIQNVFTGLFAYTYDVGRDLIKLQEITTTWDIPLIGQTTGLHGLFYGPWWYYVLIPSFLLSDGNPKGVLLFMIMLGVGTVLLALFSTSRLISKSFGLLFGSVLAVSAGMIQVSTQIWNPFIIPFYIAIVLCVYVILIKSKLQKNIRMILLIMFGFFTGLVVDSEIVFGVLFCAGIVLTALLYRKLLSIKTVFYAALGFVVVLLPRIVFDIWHNFLMTKTLLAFIGGEGTSTSTYGQLQPINALTQLFHMWKTAVSSHNELLGLTLLIVVSVSAPSVFMFLSKSHKIVYSACWSIVAMFILGLSIFPDAIWDHYIIGLPIIYIFILCSTFYWMYSAKNPIMRHSAYLLIVIVLGFNLYRQSAGMLGNSWAGDVSTYNTHINVIDAIYQDANAESFKYIVYTPPVHSYTYNYLFSWYGPKEYDYAPSEQAGIMYVIVEPDYENPERRQRWLDERSADGELLDEIELGSDIIIQKKKITL